MKSIIYLLVIFLSKIAIVKTFRCCFVKFDDEKQAKAAFEKGKTLRIGGVPVDVLYARLGKLI